MHKNHLQAWTYAIYETGVDHFGPFKVQRPKKVWALLFICLTTGAVHCEPVDTLSVDSHLNALDRFVEESQGRSAATKEGRSWEVQRITKS